MSDINQWLATKYQILGQHAQAAQTSASASLLAAQAQMAHAGMVDPAQAASLTAGAFKTRQEGQMVKPAAQAGIAGQEAQTAEQLASTDWRRANPEYGWGGVGTGTYGVAPPAAPAASAAPAAPSYAPSAPTGSGFVPPKIGQSVQLSPGVEAQPRPAAPSYSTPSFTQGWGPMRFAEGTSYVPDASAIPQPMPYAALGVSSASPPPHAPVVGLAAGTNYPQAGYSNGVPVPSGGTAYSAGGLAAGPGGSQNPRDPWGVTTPEGHSRLTGTGWSEVPSPGLYTSVDGQRPTALQKPGKFGGYNKHPYDNGGDTPATRDGLDYMGGHPEDFHYAKGTAKVPSKGKGKAPPKGKTPGKGMVEAGLAPGEAVLTPGAADHMGRDNIGMLNAMAHHGMLPSQGSHLGGQPHAAMPQSIGAIPGLAPPGGAPPGAPGAGGPPAPGGPPMKPQKGFAKGTSAVPAQDNIGQKVKLDNSKMGGKQTPDLNLKKGTAKVPGKPTNPSKDTQHGQIPVGGAVLTNDAANHVGRGLIAHLNQLHGGMSPPMAPPGGPPQGFAEGTASVPPTETNGQHLMGQLGKAWDYVTTPNPNADLQVGARGLYTGMSGLMGRGKEGYQDLNNAIDTDGRRR